jgi:hypothetical protein
VVDYILASQATNALGSIHPTLLPASRCIVLKIVLQVLMLIFVKEHMLMEDIVQVFRMSKPQEHKALQHQSHRGNVISIEDFSATHISQVEDGSLGSVANVLSKILAPHIVLSRVQIFTTLSSFFSARLQHSPDTVIPTSS